MPSYAEALALECERMCEADIGYDQSNRWGDDECDCSSLVYRCIYAIDPQTELNRTDPRYTGTLLRDLLAIGFTEVPKSRHRRGDVLLNSANHVLVDLGGGLVGGARIDENGRASGGRGGDQTGKEVCVHAYYDYPWNHVLRPPDVELGGGDDEEEEDMTEIIINVPQSDDMATNIMVYVCGDRVHDIADPEALRYLQQVYREAHGGKEIPMMELSGARSKPEFQRFLQAIRGGVPSAEIFPAVDILAGRSEERSDGNDGTE